MTTTKRKSKPAPPRYLRATRGIQNAKGERFEAGEVLTESDLALFSETAIKNWQASGVLEEEAGDGTKG